MPQKLYTTPPGFYDLPFTWTFDASQLTDGNTYLNQFIYLLGGYGDFMLRRIVGLSQILDPATGRYQIRKRDSGEYIQSEPTFAAHAYQNYYCPEIPYRELGNIRFDLYNILRPVTPGPQAAQLAFQGVRRLAGSQIVRPVRAIPKSFTYMMQVSLQNPFPAAPVSAFLQIDDYDFELHNILLQTVTQASSELAGENEADLLFTAVPIGTLGNGITINITNTNIGVPNQPLTLTVVGTVITLNLATDGFGAASTTGAQIVSLFNSNSTIAALISTQCLNFCSLAGPVGVGITAGGSSGAPIITPTTALWIYDHARVQISSAPVVDIYLDGTTRGFYGSQVGQARGENGALVPPLYYPKESQIQIDVTNLTAAPTGLIITLVGKQYYPC